MSNYDNWKLRSDRDDGPQDEPEEEVISEAEYAIHEINLAFEALVLHWGYNRARKMTMRIMYGYRQEHMGTAGPVTENITKTLLKRQGRH